MLSIGTITLVLLALALAILLPGGRTVEQHPKLPWMLKLDESGQPTVFGVTLGKSTLAEVRDNFQEQGITNLFVSPQRQFTLETYFQNLFLSGIKADMVITLDLTQSELESIYDRGLRISQLESGAKKVVLSSADLESVKHSVIQHITYIPAADLTQDLVLGRFGQAGEQITEASGIVHWLYPEKGMDIALNPNGKEVIQYIAPVKFRELIKPLLEKQD